MLRKPIGFIRIELFRKKTHLATQGPSSFLFLSLSLLYFSFALSPPASSLIAIFSYRFQLLLSFPFPSDSGTGLSFSLPRSLPLCQPRMGNLKYESVYLALEIPADIDDKISPLPPSACTGLPRHVYCTFPSHLT